MSENNLSIGNYKAENALTYKALTSAAISSDDDLKKIDTNNDNIIQEDELQAFAGEDGVENTTSIEETYDDKIALLQAQLTTKMNEKTNLQKQLADAQDSDSMDSILSSIDSVDSEINSIRKQIYTALYTKETKISDAKASAIASAASDAMSAANAAEAEAKAAEAAADAATNTTTETSATNTTTPTYSQMALAASSDNSTTGASSTSLSSASTQEFINTFNNSSFANGVLSGCGSMVASIAQEYGLDPALLSSIMAFETGWGTSNAIKKYNNPGGMMSSSGLIKYSSLEEGIRAVAKNLKNNYIDKGLTTISKIGAKYCPVGASNDPTGSNSNWVPGITKIYNKLANANVTKDTVIC